jgi:hypothetical protein
MERMVWIAACVGCCVKSLGDSLIGPTFHKLPAPDFAVTVMCPQKKMCSLLRLLS